MALTHVSAANEQGHTSNYERLEFLGDAVLELVISEILYRNPGQYPEGRMTRMRAKIVRQKSLAIVARQLQIEQFVILGKGELSSGGNQRAALLADVLEAIIGAIYLDSGIEIARQFILANFDQLLQLAASTIDDDYKTRLQELLQGQENQVIIEYRLINMVGPDHSREFEIGLYINGEFSSSGHGRNKKAAEQLAAKSWLMKNENIGLNK